MKTSFLAFIDSRIQYLKECNRIGTANNYRRAKASLLRFLQKKDLKFNDIDKRFVDNYADWLMKQGMVRNSASFHMRILRAIYNKGVKKGLARQTYPFSETYTGVDRTRKRCVNKEVISSLISLDLTDQPPLEIARDLFLFSIYTRGMSFIDIVYLKKENIREGEIIYKRRKTKKTLIIKVEKEIKSILEKYIKEYPQSHYIFPILKEESPIKCYERYLKALSLYNYRLKKISRMLGLGKSLTSYVSRHTWASIAYKMEIPVSVISCGMGHSSETVTRIYLDSMDNSVVDHANSLILSSLCVSMQETKRGVPRTPQRESLRVKP